MLDGLLFIAGWDYDCDLWVGVLLCREAFLQKIGQFGEVAECGPSAPDPDKGDQPV